MDNVVFDGLPFKLLDLESDAYAGIFLFYKCSNKLERISIRNAEIGSSATYAILPISQNELIKFICNVPYTTGKQSN